MMVVPKFCSESRMGSRISRGATEWSGDKENIYGKYFQGYRKSSDFIGIIPEVLECSGGFHGGAHLSMTSHMD